MLAHTGERSHGCDHCHKTFARSSHLRRHMLTHTGERPYTCDHCKKTFARSSHLRSHMLTHTGERPYACVHCNKTFAQSSDLRRHMLSRAECLHADRYCKKLSTCSSSLHIVDENVFYKCLDCVKLFKSQRSVMEHRLAVHNSIVEQFGCGLCGVMHKMLYEAKACFYQHMKTRLTRASSIISIMQA
jgi:KRAB domain-containing zinc finger protein